MLIAHKKMTTCLTCFLLTALVHGSTPKETVGQFLTKIYQLDFSGAAALSTDDTKSIILDYHRQIQKSGRLEEFINQKKSLPKSTANDLFEINNLSENVLNTNAIVKNSKLTVNLDKIKGVWKVVTTTKLLQDIMYAFYKDKNTPLVRKAFLEVKEKYNLVNRNISNTINYLNTSGFDKVLLDSLSILINNIPTITDNFSKTELDNYIEHQKLIGQKFGHILLRVHEMPSLINTEIFMSLKMQSQGNENKLNAAIHNYNNAVKGTNLNLFINSLR